MSLTGERRNHSATPSRNDFHAKLGSGCGQHLVCTEEGEIPGALGNSNLESIECADSVLGPKFLMISAAFRSAVRRDEHLELTGLQVV